MFVTQTFESWGEVSAHRKPASESQLGICHAQYSQAEVEFGFELQHIEGKLWDDDQKGVVFPSVPVEGGYCMEFNFCRPDFWLSICLVCMLSNIFSHKKAIVKTV